MIRRPSRSGLLVLLSLLLLGCRAPKESSVAGRTPILLVPPDGTPLMLTVEVADEPMEHERGLMGRTELADGQGMLFVFPSASRLRFWMKNTLIPLDILFVDTDLRVTSFATMEPCTADPCPLTSSEGDALYALEVPGGFVVENRIEPGWKIRLSSVEN